MNWIEQYSSDILSKDFLSSYQNKKVPWGFGGFSYIVYKRSYSRRKDDGTTEEWPETIARSINGLQKIGAQYTKEEAERLYDHIFNLRCSIAGRGLWQLGSPTVDRFGMNSLINCWFLLIKGIEDPCFLFENLMLGSGVGFSVKREHVHELPKVKAGVIIKHILAKDTDLIVPDSREGWVDLLRKAVLAFLVTGKGFTYSTILVRGYGEAINGFGGTASGPKILIDGIESICQIFKNRENKKLRSIDVLDISNIIGSIVVAGNVRRSSEIAIGDADDHLFLKAKRWDLGNIPNWRAMSNNTLAADDFDYISDAAWEGFNGNGEAYGFFNLDLAQTNGRLGEKVKDNCEGINPCLPSWTKILTPEGIRQLKDVKTGDLIWSKDGWTKIINKWSTGVKEVYEYNTTAGSFYGTKDHKIISKGQKIEVGNSDCIDSVRGEYSENLCIDPMDVMDGLIIGDGSVHKASNNLVHLCIGEDDKDYFNSEIKDLIIECRTGLHDYAYTIHTTVQSDELPLTFNRFIPDRFFYGNKSKVCGFLRGLFSANGSICGNRVTLKSSSFELIRQVQIMLSSVGIRSYYTINKPSMVKFKNGDYLCKESYDLNISIDRERFSNCIGFIQQYKNDRLKQLISEINNNRKGKETFDIISWKLVSEEEVFDITVDNSSHTFWNAGLNVSNCGEITLANKECCNLAELFLNNIESKEELLDCAKLLYKGQKAIAAGHYIHEETNVIVHKNMRLGCSTTAICQSLDKLEWLDWCYKELRQFDKEWSKKRGWNESIKLTTVKPSGTLSLLAGATPGIHPAYSEYYIRRIRLDSGDKLVEICKNAGYKTEYQIGFDGQVDYKTIIVEFPCYAGKESLLAKNVTAVQQLELLKRMQTIWSDNAVSCTVYYKKEELPFIKKWLKENYKTSIKSVSFCLHSEHGYKQPPYEEITKERYFELISKIKPIETVNTKNELLENLECSSGSCPIR